MNREKYIEQLKKELRALRVDDIDEIVEEYEEHFSNKLQEGVPEQEIVANLESPKTIARQYADGNPVRPGSGAVRVLSRTALVFLDILLFFCFATLYLAVVALGLWAVSAILVGVTLILNFPFAQIPTMPFMPQIILGISMLALGALSLVGTNTGFIYTNVLLQKYRRWHSRNWGGSASNISESPIGPSFVRRKKLRNIAVISAILFIVFFAAAFIALWIDTGTFEFWHALGWFDQPNGLFVFYA